LGANAVIKLLNNSKLIFILFIVIILFTGAIIPAIQAEDPKYITGFDKGPSYIPVVPMKKVTFVNFDENSYIDDYAYLSAVPASVFNDEGKLYSHPLLFYQDPLNIKNEKERSLDAYQGIKYFMEDFMNYSNGNLDQMILVNVPTNKLELNWKAKEKVTIEEDDPYKIASEIALQDWSYSNNAVIAVIDEDFKRLDNKVRGKVEGKISIDKSIKKEHFEVEQTNSLNPVSNDFTVPEGYMYVYARCWYPSVTIKVSLPIPGFEMDRQLVIPSGDKDMQIYCMYNGDWMQTTAFDSWNSGGGMDKEKGGTYAYANGKWRAAITDIPTKKLIEVIERHGTWLQVLKNLKNVIYQVDITIYPGERVTLFEELPFDCRGVRIELKSVSNADLDFCLIGPSGEEIATDEDGVIEVEKLGGLLPGESYDLAIFSVDDKKGTFDYEVSYSYEESKTKYESDCLTNAVEGSILASTINAPLLYTSKKELPQATSDALYRLGVKNIYLVNLGNYLSNGAKNNLNDIATLKKDYKRYEDIYEAICDKTSSNDIIISTIEPWRPWYVYERAPTDEIEMPYALHIGPAAFIAAHHGSPVLITDNHEELSSAIIWHNEYWNKGASYAPGGSSPTTAEMYLTGKRVYDFFDKLGLDKNGMESMITVAGQFNIGASWDRVFFGKANYGRFFGSPVDTAYWISRDMFYPALIFENPALNPNGINMINGSASHRRKILPWGKGGLKIDKPPKEEKMKYPVLSSFIHYEHRFNERASKYWGFTYQCADGLIPGVTNTMNPIDQGVSAYIDSEGSIFPDMSMSDVLPAYLTKGGFDNAFSTNFDAVAENVNNGVILWNHFAHGFHDNSGLTQYWYNKNDPNPWRMYEFYLGSTEEPDTLTIEIHGILPAILGTPNINGIFRSALDWAPAKANIRDKISNLLSIIPIVRRIIPQGITDTQDYYDGMINTLLLSKIGCIVVNGTQFDDNIKNLHSAGYITNACLMATKYIHLTLIRHGTSFQIMDPWPTSWYGSVWAQSVPRDIILGDTVGEAFNKGISHVGILYLSDPPQWWWDNSECVCYYGDPDLRMFVPSTDYSYNNHWAEKDTEPLKYNEHLSINGHTPFGASKYPNEREAGIKIPLWVILILLIGLLLIISFVLLRKN
jgi:hypothetical protein